MMTDIYPEKNGDGGGPLPLYVKRRNEELREENDKLKEAIVKLQAKVADLEKKKDQIYKEAMSHHEAQTGDLQDRIKELEGEREQLECRLAEVNFQAIEQSQKIQELEGKLWLWRKTRSGIDDYWAKLDPLKAIQDLKAAGEWPE